MPVSPVPSYHPVAAAPLSSSMPLRFTVATIEGLLQQIGADRRHEKAQWRVLQRVLQQRQKQLRVFFLTVDALQVYYGRVRHSLAQLVSRLEDEMDDQAYQDKVRRRDQRQAEERLTVLEQELQDLRAYAEQRRDKKARRERQYHDMYRLPVISAQYKKKYMRARDKNSQVEQDLSEVHDAIETLRHLIRESQQDWRHAQQRMDALEVERRSTVDQLQAQQLLLKQLQQAQGYWCQFDTRHLQPCLEWLNERLRSSSMPVGPKSPMASPSVASYASPSRPMASAASFRTFSSPSILSSSSSRSSNDLHDAQWTSLRLMAVAYEQAEQHGLETWPEVIHGRDDVQFDCSMCMDTCHGWPCIDKVYTTRLLCHECYQSTRTSMIIEKKVQRFVPNDANGQPVIDLRRLSTPLVKSASKSTQLLLHECRPLLKKMKSALVLKQQLI
ncbi:hypothetical protein BC940DRAFT_345375 [Gongronella butleri]|nr:hypothetical protein BC940DRAFT_345375 [Gongronella butleri]